MKKDDLAYFTTQIDNKFYEIVITYNKISNNIGNGRNFIESNVDEAIKSGKIEGKINDNGTELSWLIKRIY